MSDPRACEHSFEFSSDIDEPNMKCDKCGEPLEIVSSIELAALRNTPRPSEPAAPSPRDEEETADLHMQWASDGDDLEASFDKLHAYAKRLEVQLKTPPPAGVEFVPRQWMDSFCKIGDIMGPEDWVRCEDLIEMVRKMKAAPPSPGSVPPAGGGVDQQTKEDLDTLEGAIYTTSPEMHDCAQPALDHLRAALAASNTGGAEEADLAVIDAVFRSPYGQESWSAACAAWTRVRALAGSPAEARPTLLTWTREKPKEADYYWVRIRSGDKKGKGNTDLGIRMVVPEEWNHPLSGTWYEFSGPISQPHPDPVNPKWEGADV